MALEVLQELGLTKSEIKSYLALLELGQSTTGPIVDKAKISSSKIYKILDKLIQKGLVSYVLKGSVKYFEATQPERILDLIKEKEKELEKHRKDIEKILPELTRKKELTKIKENAAIYRGMNGLDTVFYESLNLMKKGQIQYVIGIPSRSDKVNRFFTKWNRYRATLGIKAKMLFNEYTRGEMQTLPENNPDCEIKYMPEGIITPAAINIFNNRIVIFPKETSEDPLLIVIDNKEITDSFMAQFELLWNQTTVTFTGLEGPRYVLKDMVRAGKEINSFGLEEDKIQKHIPNELREYIKEVERKKIPEKLIFLSGSKVNASKYAKVKYLPKRYFTPAHYEIYGDKVAIFYWEKPITVTIIENKGVAESFRNYFNNLWKIAKEK